MQEKKEKEEQKSQEARQEKSSVKPGRRMPWET